MDYAHASRADRLASAYVVGTLRGPARRRFEALLAAHPVLREATWQWEQRLMPLTLAVTPEAPPARVWSHIQSRIDGTSAHSSAPAARAGWASTLGFWRGWAGLASVAALALLVAVAMPRPVQAPIIVVLSAPEGAPAGTPPIVASLSADRRALVTRPVAQVTMQPDRALELWAIAPGQPARSMGVISADGTTVVERREALVGADTLAVTIEPPGGSPTGKATGPIVYVGKFSL